MEEVGVERKFLGCALWGVCNPGFNCRAAEVSVGCDTIVARNNLIAVLGLANSDWCDQGMAGQVVAQLDEFLHCQLPPSAQGKLVRCVAGAIFDVAVDLRRGSPSYGRFITAKLSAKNWRQLWIPRGFAHGLCTLTEDAEVLYKVDAPYDAAADSVIRWDDPAIGIEWPLTGKASLSDKDRVAPPLAGFDPPEAW